MRGEELDEAFIGFGGVHGDRVFAFLSTARPENFPYLTAREQEQMLCYRPRFRPSGQATQPPNPADVEKPPLGQAPRMRVSQT